MNKEMIITNLLANYGKYGVTKEKLEENIKDGLEKYNLSLKTIYNGLRMTLASAFGEQEFFSVEDIAEITGETKEEVIARIEQCRNEIVSNGGNPDDYFIEKQRAAVHFFPNGIH